MSEPRCDPDFPSSLPQHDIDNYHNAYHADAVADFTGDNTAGPHAVRLTWDAGDIHNERAYLINRLDTCTGQWQIFDTALKNASSKTLNNVQGGDQLFQVLPLTNADPQHSAGDPSAVITVDVVANLSPPAGMAATFPTAGAHSIEWTPVTGADHYKVLTWYVLFGLYAPECSGAIMSTSSGAEIPPGGILLSGMPYHRKVMACDAADLCSALSDAFTVTERFDQGVWDYAFTYYRSVDDIHLDFINFNPNGMALQLDIHDGDTSGSPRRAWSACTDWNVVGTVGPISAALFSSGKLATRGHGIDTTEDCAPKQSHGSDSSAVGWGPIPPRTGACCAPPPTPGPVGGIAQVPGIDGPGGGSGAWAFGVAAAALAALLGAGAVYLRRARQR